MFRAEGKAAFPRLLKEHVLDGRGYPSACPSAFLWISPAIDARQGASRHGCHGVDAATESDDGRCRFHARNIAIIASNSKPIYCDDRSFLSLRFGQQVPHGCD